MALDPNDLVTMFDGPGSGLRFFPAEGSVQPLTFASGTGTLEPGTAITFNTSTEFYQVFRGTTNEVNTLTAHAATPATAGDFTLTVTIAGVADTTTAIAFDATAVVVQAALEALDNVAVGDVVCTQTAGTDLGDASGQVTITWQGLASGQDITFTADQTGISAGSDMTVATATAGGANEANGTQIIKGFVWPDPIVLSATGEVLGNVMFAGMFHIDDVPLVSTVYDRFELEAAIRTAAFRESGFICQGLANWIR